MSLLIYSASAYLHSGSSGSLSFTEMCSVIHGSRFGGTIKLVPGNELTCQVKV